MDGAPGSSAVEWVQQFVWRMCCFWYHVPAPVCRCSAEASCPVECVQTHFFFKCTHVNTLFSIVGRKRYKLIRVLNVFLKSCQIATFCADTHVYLLSNTCLGCICCSHNTLCKLLLCKQTTCFHNHILHQIIMTEERSEWKIWLIVRNSLHLYRWTQNRVFLNINTTVSGH